MSSRISAGDPGAVLRDERGAAALSTALIMPLVLLVSLGFVDFALLVSDMHRATEATRRAARAAAIAEPIPAIDTMAEGSEIVCTANANGVDCGGAAVTNPAVFDAVLAEARRLIPDLGHANLAVTYTHRGLGDADRPSGILPLIRVDLRAVTFRFRALRIFPGAPETLTLPSFESVQIASGMAPD